MTRGGVDLLVFACVFAAQALVAIYVGDNGWDDGTITLAFARTFADTGRIALTPHSAIVEGYSSPAWLLLTALAHRIASPDFDGFIRLAQLLTAVFGALSALLLFRMSRPALGSARAAMVAVLVLAGAPFLNEAMNAMEMTLVAFLALLLARRLERSDGRHGVALFVLAAALAAVRFEVVLYVVAGAAFVYAATGERTTALRLALGATAGALGVEACRLLYFGEWLPNPILAKRWPPYRPVGWGATLESHLLALTEVAQVYGVPLALTLLLLWRRSSVRAAWDSIRQHRALAFAVGYAVAVIAVNAAFGRNWGYPGRMQLSALPLLFLAVVGVSAPLVRRPALYWPALALLAFLGSLVALQWEHVGYAVAARDPGGGAGERHRAPTTAVTPDNYRDTGTAVDALRQQLGLATLTFMVPDIGGTSLCCERLAIVDSGLLADRFLAHQGYAGFAAYLAQRRPDVIETHAFWAAPSAIYAAPEFLAHYRPIVVDGIWLYLRDDHVEALRRRGATNAPVADTAQLKYRGNPYDEAFVATRGVAPLVLAPMRR